MFSIAAIFNTQGAQSLPIKDDTNVQKYNVHVRNGSIIVAL